RHRPRLRPRDPRPGRPLHGPHPLDRDRVHQRHPGLHLLAKLIITGRTRTEALQRAARALNEFQIEGMATALPFHRKIVTDPAFAPEIHGQEGPFTVHTRWIETEFTNDIPAFTTPADTDTDDDTGRETVVVEVGGKRLEVSLPASLGMSLARTGLAAGAKPKRRAARKTGPVATGDTLASPMQGTIVKVAVEDGQQVQAGDLVVVLEAMKMEQPINAHKAGTIKGLTAQVGASITSGAPICEITG
ncbi:biotin/lipoyl-binding protein, partial [Streptomyces sp. WAC00469]